MCCLHVDTLTGETRPSSRGTSGVAATSSTRIATTWSRRVSANPSWWRIPSSSWRRWVSCWTRGGRVASRRRVACSTWGRGVATSSRRVASSSWGWWVAGTGCRGIASTTRCRRITATRVTLTKKSRI